jgi:ATP-dependent DNA ligase
LERRLNLGRGSLVVFDYIPTGLDRITPYKERKTKLLAALKDLPNWQPWQLGPPIQDAIYTIEGYVSEAVGELYDVLQDENRALDADLYEGLVAKRTNSPYPIQQRSPSEESTFWVKHRWDF